MHVTFVRLVFQLQFLHNTPLIPASLPTRNLYRYNIRAFRFGCEAFGFAGLEVVRTVQTVRAVQTVRGCADRARCADRANRAECANRADRADRVNCAHAQHGV